MWERRICVALINFHCSFSFSPAVWHWLLHRQGLCCRLRVFIMSEIAGRVQERGSVRLPVENREQGRVT